MTLIPGKSIPRPGKFHEFHPQSREIPSPFQGKSIQSRSGGTGFPPGTAALPALGGPEVTEIPRRARKFHEFHPQSWKNSVPDPREVCPSPEKPNPLFYLLENPPRNSRILAPFRPLWNGQIPKKKPQTRPTPPRKIQGCPSLWMRRIPRKKGNHPEIFKYFINIRSWGEGKIGKIRKMGSVFPLLV